MYNIQDKYTNTNNNKTKYAIILEQGTTHKKNKYDTQTQYTNRRNETKQSRPRSEKRWNGARRTHINQIYK